MKLSLINKHAIVCGSTDGIGKASALLLAKQGCEITLVARNQDKLDNTQSELNTDHNQKHYSVCADFDKSMDLKKKIKMHMRSLGRSVDILVNNSGGPHGGPLIEADEDEFRAAFERLLIGNHIMAKAVVPGMKDKGVGRIVNIISTSVKQVIPGLGVSNTIRGSVAQWGKTLALELGEHGICVNNILPGYTATDRLKYLAESKANSLSVDIEDIRNKWAENTSLKRIGNVDEVANTVLFLASDESSYVTGHNFSVDGGRFSA
ncbi:MAG: SDR family oxidoreductase [Candidatus Neomarinimicrobiota bacterium]